MADKEFAQKKILVTGVGGGKLSYVHTNDSRYYISMSWLLIILMFDANNGGL